MSDNFKMVAKTFQGLEHVLADELRELGAENVQVGRRAVEFEGDKRLMYRANFCCRTALRILKPILSFNAKDADELYAKARAFDWSTVLSPEQTFAIDATVYSEDFRHSRFVTYRVKDAIADYFNETAGKRPGIRLNNPDLQLDVYISEDRVIISLDSSGEPLYKRGYRVAQTDAPINEVLAAGIIKLTGWHGECDFIDPMCGSGTFLIEAALIARNIYPGVYRSDFAFEHWRDFDSELFESIFNDDTQEREFEHHIYGSDISPKAIDIANRNIRNASLTRYITTEIRSLQNIEEVPKGGIVVSNPPYGERISVEDMENFYKSIGSQLKNVFKGYNAWLIGPANELFDAVGLKPSLKYPMLNGSIECELRQYVVFDGTYSEFRKEGGSVRNSNLSREDAKPGSRFDREKKSKPYERDRKPFGRDRKPFERDRKPFDRDRKPYADERRKLFDKDGEGERKREGFTRRYGDRPRPSEPRNALEARYRAKSGFGEHDGRGEGFRPDAERKERLHGEEFLERIIKNKEPQLGAELERPIMHGRRKSWKRLQAGEVGSRQSLAAKVKKDDE